MTEQGYELAYLWWKFVGDFFTYTSTVGRNESIVDNPLVERFQRLSGLFLEPHKEATNIRRLIDH